MDAGSQSCYQISYCCSCCLSLFQGDTVTHCAQQSVHINTLRTKRALQINNAHPHTHAGKWGGDLLTTKKLPSWDKEEAFEYFGFTAKGFSNSVYSECMLAKSDLQGLTLTTCGTICGCGSSLFLHRSSGVLLSTDHHLVLSISWRPAQGINSSHDCCHTDATTQNCSSGAMKAFGGHDSTAKILSNACEDTWKHVVAPQWCHKYDRNRTCPSNSGPKQVTHPSAIVRQSLLLHRQMCLLIEQLLDTVNRCEGRHLVGP